VTSGLSSSSLAFPPRDEIVAACWRRIEAFRSRLAESRVQMAVLHSPVSAQYLTGVESLHGWPAVVVITTDRVWVGRFSGGPDQLAQDGGVVLRAMRGDRHTTETYEMGRSVAKALEELVGGSRRDLIGVEEALLPRWLGDVVAPLARGLTDVAEMVATMRRRKDAIEIATICGNIAMARAGYVAAESLIEPGRTELEVYEAMRSAVDHLAGTAVPLGGDFTSGPGTGMTGGPASRHALAEGDSYIIDFWPSFRGYWADLCRTYPVGRCDPALSETILAVSDALSGVGPLLRPGTPVSEIDADLRAKVAQNLSFPAETYSNISGHGLGLEAHESPWIVSVSADALAEGDVVALEPGCYDDRLRGGVRVEENYLVTSGGGQLLANTLLEPALGDREGQVPR
jgi:Xaa-Pro dipeptidase